MNRKFSRGEIYYIAPGCEVGCEQIGGRPAIIVSNDVNNRHSRTVEVVMLTGRRKPHLPTHVRIRSAKYPSTALCAQITTVAKERIKDYVGTLTPQEQMDVDKAMLVSIAIPYEEVCR